ncbi:MAG: hypothetical protein D8M58_08485 [Calditrichaeota bacterium]|nr:MAG: hypothetical protein DWQ03_18005 [Calditrichota bacterium]MBL1205419.1 hypothetical protein [Calditrichota bacterium]NOG45248.1 hypothetical protein [Calditrichota bacterium]
MLKFTIGLIFLFLPFSVSSQINIDSLYSKGMQKDWTQAQVNDFLAWETAQFSTAGGTLRQSAIMNGNKITTEIWNFGSISSPGNRITDIIWEGLGYGYEFGPFVGSEVPVPKGSHHDVQIKRDNFGRVVTDDNGDTVWVAHVISDGLKSGPEISGDLTTRWAWQPLVQSDDGETQFLTLESQYMPTSDDGDTDSDGKPDSWPKEWFDENLRKYVWPGALGLGATNADKETFFVMDDRDNLEFQYFPYPGETDRRGLGLEVEARYYQWSNAEAEDAIFLIYKIQNKGHFDLEKVAFGMWGDPHIGGPDDWRDDWANFDKEFEMTFAWDADGFSLNDANIIPGYLGYKFLESPGVSTDGIDNDLDGLVDESWTDGIDNDGDWRADTDDIGRDGIPNTGDEGEKDGVPTAGDPFDITKPGEPNFEFTDIDESDMLGLTSFAQPLFSGLSIGDDEKMWTDYLQSGQFDTTQVQGDYVFLYGSGKFTLKSIFTVSDDRVSDAIKRFSIALIVAADRNDLILNAKAVQRIYNSGYQFAKPPEKPNVTIVPGDRKVTLYWDDVAEGSVDPISKEQDFEGYVIYRSTDPKFLDQQTITDANGNSFLFEPLKTDKGVDARFDLANGLTGPSSIPYTDRGISYYLGDDRGLRHVFVDSNNVINGQTYFYAVVSYDRGSDSLNVAPSECSKIISFNPVTNVYNFDTNTGRAIPRSKVAGYERPYINDADDNNGIIREEGFSTGNFSIDIIDERQVESDNVFKIEFADTSGETEYSVLDTKEKSQTFISFYENSVPLKYNYLRDISILSTDGNTEFQAGTDFEIDSSGGSIIVFDPNLHPGAQMQDDKEYLARYKNYPIYRTTKIDSELSNPVFDGLRLVVKESDFQLNNKLTGWSASSRGDLDYLITRETGYAQDPFDYEIKFFDTIVDTTPVLNVKSNFKVIDVSTNDFAPYEITETNNDGVWDLGETINIIRGPVSPNNIVWQVTLNSTDSVKVIPGSNDVFFLSTDKPFSNGDRFSFSTQEAVVNVSKAKNQLDRINVVPNPYIATNAIEPVNTVSSSERGFRRLYFNHLPAKCTIRIYTTSGELVKVLHHDSTLDDGKEFWNLLTKDNMEVAYGLYFFHVDAPGIGKKVGKFAIIK